MSGNQALTITNTDKGGKVIVLDFVQYGEICLKHLEDPVYQQVFEFGAGRGRIDLRSEPLFNENFTASDPADHLVRLLTKELMTLLAALFRKGHVSAGEKKWLQPSQPYSSMLPHFYGLPKVHKVGPVNICPIMSSCEMFSDNLMKKLK